MSFQPTSSARTVTLPSDRFYWALLELDEPLIAQPWRARWESRRRQEEWLYRFEEVLPLPVEQVHAVFLTVDRHRILACGMEREILEEYRQEGVLDLGPEAGPRHLSESVLASLKINLLTGPMAPPALVASRRRWINAACLWLCIALVAISLGLMRRASANFDAVTSLSTQTSTLIHDALADRDMAIDAIAGSLPPELQLTAELRKMRQTRRQPASSMAASGNAGDSLVALLQAWPKVDGLRTEFIGVTSATLSVAGVVDDSAVAAQWSQGFASIPGWRLEQPEMSGVAGTSVRLALRWTPVPLDSKQTGTTDSSASRREDSQ